MIFQKQELYESSDFSNQAKEYFNEQGQIQLQQFFKEKSFEEFSKELLSKKTKFTLYSNPLLHKYYNLDNKNSSLIIKNGIEYFKSKQFQDYIQEIVGFTLDFKEIQISKFTHKCYELLHDSKVTHSLLIDIYFFITKDEFFDEYGGHKTYTTFDEELFYLTPQHNTLTCIFRDDEMREYTKYINCLAKNKEYVQIKCTFEISENLTEDLI